MRAVSNAICTSGEPVSVASRRCWPMISVLRSLVIAISILNTSAAIDSCLDLFDHFILVKCIKGVAESKSKCGWWRNDQFLMTWRVLEHAEDCKGTFQATFLLLARKLRTLKKLDSLASWLHGVAHRVALDAKRQVARSSFSTWKAHAGRSRPAAR